MDFALRLCQRLRVLRTTRANGLGGFQLFRDRDPMARMRKERSSSAKLSLNQADLAGCDRLLVPLDAHARRLWDVNLPVADFEVPLQDGIAPIQPFQ
jgi:hypothetical protein